MAQNILKGLLEYPLESFRGPLHGRQNYFLERLVGVANGEEQRERFATAVSQLGKLGAGEKQFVGRTMSMLDEFGLLGDQLEREHIENDWFRGWFPGQPVAELLVNALDLAMKQASENNKRVEIYWVASVDSKVRFAVASSPVQISVLAQTPPPKYERLVQVDADVDPIIVVEAPDDTIIQLTPVRRITLIGDDLRMRRGLPRMFNRVRQILGR